MKFKGLLIVSLLSLIVFFSCSKINEATDLGGGLIPAVDNINTFEISMNAETSYRSFNDTTKALIGDNMALGKINDPVFGSTTADMFFTLGSSTYGSSPFSNKDSVSIDSVVLSLAYKGGYGDTTGASQINVQVSEIAPGNGFEDSVIYTFDQPAFSTTGPVLGSRSFNVKSLSDSILIKPRPSDSSKVANVLRIRLNNSLGDKLKNFDTSSTSPGYGNDSLFRKAFRGLAITTTSASSPGTLAYFNLNDATNTQLLVYCQIKRSGNVKDTVAVAFTHRSYSQANSIRRTPSGTYLANLNSLAPQTLYLQSSPGGSYVDIRVPDLDNFANKIVYRAELIAYKIADPANENTFTVPQRLLLDHKGGANGTDTAYAFDKDLQVAADGSLNFASFGGTLQTDNSYRFNITRYVQELITNRQRNDTMRLYAPLRSILFSKNLNAKAAIPNLSFVSAGRVMLAGGAYINPAMRLRLRIIYSNL